MTWMAKGRASIGLSVGELVRKVEKQNTWRMIAGRAANPWIEEG